MGGVRRGEWLFSARKPSPSPSPYRLPGHASSKPHEVIVLWRSRRSRLCRLYTPDDTEDLRWGERNHADPNIAYVDGGVVPEHTLATLAFVVWSVRCCPTDVEANPSSSIGSRDDNGSRRDISAEAKRKTGRRIEFPFKNCPEPDTFIV
jgi:hypothetical protein